MDDHLHKNHVTDYPWSGSLRPVSNKLMKGGRRPGSDDPGSSPWAGSLRHVDPNKKGKKMKKKHDDGKLFLQGVS